MVGHYSWALKTEYWVGWPNTIRGPMPRGWYSIGQSARLDFFFWPEKLGKLSKLQLPPRATRDIALHLRAHPIVSRFCFESSPPACEPRSLTAPNAVDILSLCAPATASCAYRNPKCPWALGACRTPCGGQRWLPHKLPSA